MTATASPTTNGNRIQQTPLDNLSGLLTRAKQQIANALPRHLTAERMIRMAMTLFSKNDQLKKCDPLSIVACVVQSSELGLELTGPLGHAWMVPYGGNATFQIGYKGFFELAFRSGKVSSFPMRTVYANDILRVDYGTEQKLIHRPAMKDRGEVIGYYACINLRDGGRDFEFMSVEDINEHRRKYVKNSGASSPWNTAFDAMAMKTCVRMLAKRVPVSTELNVAAAIDENQEAGVPLDLDFKDRNLQVAAAISSEGAPAEAEFTPAPSSPPAESQQAEINLQCQRTGVFNDALNALVKEVGAKKLPDLTGTQAAALIAKLQALPDKQREPGDEPD